MATIQVVESEDTTPPRAPSKRHHGSSTQAQSAGANPTSDNPTPSSSVECGHCNRKGHIRKDCPHKGKPWTEVAPTSGKKDRKKHWSGRNKKLQPVTYCATCKRWHFDDSGGHLPGAAHDKFIKSTEPAASSGTRRRRGRHMAASTRVTESNQAGIENFSGLAPQTRDH